MDHQNTPKGDAQHALIAASRRRPLPQTARFLLRALLWAALLILSGAALVALLTHLQGHQGDIASWQAASAQVKRWGLVIQVAVLVVVIAAWKPLIAWARRREIVKRHEYERVLALRWHAALVALAYLILVPIGPTTLWRMVSGG